MLDKIYKHCGSEYFDKKRFVEIRNQDSWVKPVGGLWASQLNSNNGWDNWVVGNDYKVNYYKNKHFLFKLNSDKILTITNHNQLFSLPQQQDCTIHSITSRLDWIFLDFEILSKTYDAIEVLISEDYELYHYLMGWDCDSILVLNPNVIEEIKES